jgi:TolB-like protein
MGLHRMDQRLSLRPDHFRPSGAVHDAHYIRRQFAHRRPRLSIAVLPFRNLSNTLSSYQKISFVVHGGLLKPAERRITFAMLDAKLGPAIARNGVSLTHVAQGGCGYEVS